MISVIIPTLNAEKYIGKLLDSLNSQTLIPDEIIVVDSQSDDNTVSICQKYFNVNVISILRKDFDHGKTRDMALRKSNGDVVIFMTQDALPANKYTIENLLRHLKSQAEIAVVSGRQLPREDSSLTEKLVRKFNYPSISNLRQKADIDTYGIKTFYCSDVCAAYDKEIYLKLGGFEYPLKTNEDMFYAAKAINNGYKVGYAAEAEVIHSHDFTLKEQYKRNYLLGYEMEKHHDLLGNISADQEGFKLVKYVSVGLLKKGKFFSFVRFGFDCCARLIGNKSGKGKCQNDIYNNAQKDKIT